MTSERSRVVGAHPANPSDLCHLLLAGEEVPLRFVRDGEDLILVAGERSSLWPSQILRQGSARLRLQGTEVRGTTGLVTEPGEKARLLELFRTRYGNERVERWFSHPARIVRVRPGGGSGTGRDRYAQWVEAEFDNVAPEYEEYIADNRINRLMRERSLRHLKDVFAGAHRLLELGCGTGLESLPLLRDGHEMVCLDISSKMLEVLEARARSEGLSGQLTTRKLRVGELATCVKELGTGGIDGAYSTFGALNCEPDLSELPSSLSQLLRPGGRFVAGAYNRWCLFEIVTSLATLRFGKAFARARNPLPVGGTRFCVDVYSRSPGELARLLSPWFEPVRLEGLPVLLPPSDLSGYAEKFSRRFDTLAAWDARLAVSWPWRFFGDYFLLTLRRQSSGGGEALQGR